MVIIIIIISRNIAINAIELIYGIIIKTPVSLTGATTQLRQGLMLLLLLRCTFTTRSGDFQIVLLLRRLVLFEPRRNNLQYYDKYVAIPIENKKQDELEEGIYCVSRNSSTLLYKNSAGNLLRQHDCGTDMRVRLNRIWFRTQTRVVASYSIQFNSSKELLRWIDNNQIDCNHDEVEGREWRHTNNLEKCSQIICCSRQSGCEQICKFPRCLL